jgi:NAD(P)-dependent dehydrogenase (short-subunit alcohol dehydrogenase family)
MTGIEIPMLSIPKSAVVTGGNSGIGKATRRALLPWGLRHHARRCRKGRGRLHRQPDQFDGNCGAGG